MRAPITVAASVQFEKCPLLKIEKKKCKIFQLKILLKGILKLIGALL